MHYILMKLAFEPPGTVRISNQSKNQNILCNIEKQNLIFKTPWKGGKLENKKREKVWDKVLGIINDNTGIRTGIIGDRQFDPT